MQRWGELCRSWGEVADETTTMSARALKAKAMLLCTEEYLVRMMEQNPETAQKKVTKRLGQIGDKFQYTDVHPGIRQKVRDLCGL